MKQKLTTLAAAVLIAAMTPSSRAALYADSTGDVFTASILDITSVEVTNDFANVLFKINLAGNPVATDWGKYCLGIDTNSATGDTGVNGNGWGRAISMTPNGMDYWVGTWVDGSMGANFYSYDGAFWSGLGGASVSKTTSNVTISIPIAALGKTYGESFDFDVYTTGGGGGDPAIDSLANPNQTVGDWSTPYGTNLVVTYTLVTPPIPSTNNIKFMVDMAVPIWEYDNTIANGFPTNLASVYVRGDFNSWSIGPQYQLIQVGPTLFSNTVPVVQYLGQNIQYKFYIDPNTGEESPFSSCGANRVLTITNLNQTAPLAYWSDRNINDPTNNVTFEVDMALVRNFGQFDPNTHSVTMPGNFNGWNNTALTLSPGTGSNSNIYSTTFSYPKYPTNACNIGFYKFFIKDNPSARDGGWELPIQNGGGNRAFSVGGVSITNRYWYNDENPAFTVTAIQKLSDDSAKITWQSFPARGTITTGGQYAIESLDTLSGTWTTNGTVGSTTSSSSFTNNGLTGTSARFYRVGLIGL